MSNLRSDQKENWMTKKTDIDFLDSSIEHDKILVVEGQKFHVISKLLSVSSEFFEGLFNVNSGFKEANEKEIEIKDVTADDFREFLKAIYPAPFSTTAEKYRSLTALAGRFLSGTVLQKCRLFMLENFDKLDPIDVIEIVFQYNMKELKDKFVMFLRKDTTVACTGCNGFGCKTCYRCYIWHGHTMISSNYDSFLKRNKDRISKLPVEIQSFILEILLDPKKTTA